ncbi:MAG: hypothetical protein JXA82_06095 [Sedimentisphaerales bacterium]|nr:hypothetical protein [Sedimentisphaerales bacterium]
MKEQELRQVVAYVNEIEEALFLGAGTLIPWQIELTPLNHTIARLKQARFAIQDRKIRIICAHTALRARQCRDRILRRCGMKASKAG